MSWSDGVSVVHDGPAETTTIRPIAVCLRSEIGLESGPVSYTHLTLPTILRV